MKSPAIRAGEGWGGGGGRGGDRGFVRRACVQAASGPHHLLTPKRVRGRCNFDKAHLFLYLGLAYIYIVSFFNS